MHPWRVNIQPSWKTVLKQALASIGASAYRETDRCLREIESRTAADFEPLKALMRERIERDGILLVEGLPIDEELPATPLQPCPEVEKGGQLSERSLLFVAGIFGTVFSYAEEKNGAIIHNVYPLQETVNVQSNDGSRVDLSLHTEIACFDNRPDFIVLIGLREHPSGMVPTEVADVAKALASMDEADRRTLEEALFLIRPPNSFAKGGLDSPVERPQSIVYRGDDGQPRYRVNFNRGIVTPLNDRAAIAYSHFAECCRNVRTSVSVTPGTALVIDNRRWVHGRSPFVPRFDGSDRWLQRVYVRQYPIAERSPRPRALPARRTGPRTVPRIEAPSADDFRTMYASQGTPVIITGAMEPWKASKIWTKDYLASRLGNRKYLVNRSPDGRFGIYSSRMTDGDTSLIVTIGQFFQLLEDALPKGAATPTTWYYMQQKRVHEVFPELVEDVDYPDLFPSSSIRDVNVWLSQMGSNIPLHFDTHDNLLAQVRGRKSFKLFGPEQSRWLYPGLEGADFASKVDIHRPNVDEHPLFTNARVDYEDELREGEMLYLPPFWWHHVVTTTPLSISINYWYHLVYAAPRDRYMAAQQLLDLGISRLRELTPTQRQLLSDRAAAALECASP